MTTTEPTTQTEQAIKARYYRKGNGVSERLNRTVPAHPLPTISDDEIIPDPTRAICLSDDGRTAQEVMIRRIVAALNYTEGIPLEELEKANVPLFERQTCDETKEEGK